MNMLLRFIFTLFVLKIAVVLTANFDYAFESGSVDISDEKPHFITFNRERRDIPATNLPTTSSETKATILTAASIVPPTTQIDINNVKKSDAETSNVDPPKQHLLGVNGSGILHVTTAKVSDPILATVDTKNDSDELMSSEKGPATLIIATAAAIDTHQPGLNNSSVPKVSDPILANDAFANIFKETPEMIKAEENIANLTYDNHNFYNSTFIGNLTYFEEYWNNITQSKAETHEILSNSHRRATTVKLSFDFPFYGHGVSNITVATGGFLYTGDLVHNWLAATQYISPLMANFDTTLTNDSVVKLYDDGEKFTVFWVNATLQEAPTKKFTFAVTLLKNGDIVFAYKDIPIPIQSIDNKDHPVKVGISDAYLKDKILFYVRRKTIYEYHRVSFKNHVITNSTILKLVALPTCLQYNTCATCTNHDTGFDCTWCERLQKCSSGTDRNKQDWLSKNCDILSISSELSCPAAAHVDAPTDTVNTAYATDTLVHHDTVVNAMDTDDVKKAAAPIAASATNKQPASSSAAMSGVITVLCLFATVCCLAGWLLYAFKNPLSPSGQLLIRYRPSQWGWRRGEARYTAATIHM